jgi:hypothetical protein
MLFVILGVVVALLGPVGWFLWPLMARSAVRGDFRPSIQQRVELILGPHEGRQVSDEVLAELQRQVERVVRDTLIDLRRADDHLTITVRNDDVLGPVCRVRTGDEVEMSLADFEAQLRA